MDDLVAYLDESRKPVRDLATGRVAGRGEHYVVAAAVVIDGDLGAIRAEITDIETRLRYRLHYADLRGRERKTAVLTALDEVDGWDAYVFETRRPLPTRNFSEHHVRAKILAVAFTLLGNDVGTSRVVLETRATPVRPRPRSAGTNWPRSSTPSTLASAGRSQTRLPAPP